MSYCAQFSLLRTHCGSLAFQESAGQPAGLIALVIRPSGPKRERERDIEIVLGC
jgi:hypothetical protein